ncbi:cytochrome P450 2G1 [Bombina bombina]|uniref:cytochrome P450 2G1 n=1 Tax=Bombina bombina TaxID=8345 RepID=UPI00235AADDF|nr:cytochrome P450 2G1 [Bombina bombina]
MTVMDISGNLVLLLLIILLGVMTIIWWKKSIRIHSQLPPGPTPLPLIGNILQVNPKAFLESLQKFREKYGPVYTVYFGSHPVVVMCGYEAVKEALVDNGEFFVNRGKMPLSDYINKGFGVLGSNGERWRTLRRFSLTTLRNFGMGKKSLEERIQEETHYLVEKLGKMQGKPIDPTFLLSCAVSNIICSIVFGQRFDYTDKKFLSLLNDISISMRFTNSTWGLIFFFFHKLLRHFPGPHFRGIKHLKDIREFVKEQIRHSQENLDPNFPQHFIDCFLVKMQQEKQNPNTEFHMENLLVTTINLFFAGTETVSTTLRYGFLILIKYPEIQEKIQDEIDKAIGRQRCPCIEDRMQMPYTDAVIHEIQRFGDILPTGVPHSTTHDITFRGYKLPKGTDIYPLLTTVLQDPEQFSSPGKFYPERFLDDQGNLKKNVAFMPFSTGKRMCPGEGLARLEIFLFLTSVLQNFTLTTDVPLEKLDLTSDTSSAGRVPRPYHMFVCPRT